MRKTKASLILALALTLGVLSPSSALASDDSFVISGNQGSSLQAEVITQFDEPWAMTFLPDGQLLVTTKPGGLYLVTQAGEKREVEGLWPVAYGGQGGLGDVIAHPNFSVNHLIYLSSVEPDESGQRFGALVRHARLEIEGERARLVDAQDIWRQSPKVGGKGHFSHRLAFDAEGYLFITSGDRQKLTPAQDFETAMGKIIRLQEDGRIPLDNPWQDQGDLAKSFWSMGHRNMLGMDFDARGQLWAIEMGPRHGDELNLIQPGQNYGWPLVSNGNHYSGEEIPNHDTRPEFAAPTIFWVPAISPAGFVIYKGELFKDWQGMGFMGGLSARALVRVSLDAKGPKEEERFEWGKRVREVEEGPDGAIWLLEDRAGARLLRLTPLP